MITFISTKDNYIKFKGQKVKFKGRVVTVGCHMTESRGGSWERGFRFSTSYWAKLTNSKGQVSFNHGETWGTDIKCNFKTSQGKMKLSAYNHGELAFEGIQKINREYEGPSYQWRR